MHKVSSIVFCPEDYDNNEIMMFSDIADLLKILFKCKYECAIHQEDFGIVVVEYDYTDVEFRTYTHAWLDSEELDALDIWRCEKERENE